MDYLKYYSTVLLSLICSLLLSKPTNATNQHDGDNQHIILVPEQQGLETGAPRTPIIIPIEAFFSTQTMIITVKLAYNLGTVDISLINTTYGTISNYQLDNSVGIDSIPIPSSNSHYWICFSFSSLNKHYYGEFDVIP